MALSRRKPTLMTRTMHQHLLAIIAGLLVSLVGLLWVTDRLMLYSRRHALGSQLRALDTVDDAVLVLCSFGEEESGSVLLDMKGHWRVQEGEVIGQRTGSSAPAGGWHEWTEVAEVAKAGAWHETGKLPWVKEEVIWAASVLTAPDGHREILVAWEPVAAVREAVLPVYLVVVGATLLAFIISVGLGLRGTRQVTTVLADIADSSARMAAGDYEVRLSAQSTRELDQVVGSINRLAGSLREATAELRAEEEQIKHLEGLQRRFVADASHELRAPLTSMRVTLEAWNDGVLRPGEYGSAVRHLLAQTTRLGKLVTELLDLARIESGREELNLGPVRVSDAAEQALRMFRDLPGARIELEAPGEMPLVLADAEALQRVVINVLENARRYTPESGSIRVSAALRGEMVEIAVSDGGCGIAPEMLPMIWDRFARSPEAEEAGTKGSGLGLAIVKALVEAMGGEVAAESSPGKGTTIRVTLRAARGEAGGWSAREVRG